MTISDRTERILLDYVRDSREEQKATRTALTDVSNKLADATGHLLVLDQRMGVVEGRVERLDCAAENTGRHNMKRLEKELAEHKAALAEQAQAEAQAKRKAITDWVVRFTVGVVLLGVGALVTLLLKGCAG